MKFFFFIILVLICSRSLSQSVSVGGLVVDEKNVPLPAAIISVKNNNIEKYHSLTNKEGVFLIPDVTPGFYHINISFLGKNVYDDSFHVGDNNIYLGALSLFPASQMLGEVKVINKVQAITEKDDTIELNSSAYKLNEDADAADLVRKMPAIDINGSAVTAQGETVVKVLLDGKPFFGDNPYTTLKNLPADIIDKVQVYNEKSDQERFTGFNEGNTKKTINIITKPDRRHGVFGNVYAGDGSDNSDDNKYGTGGTINKFNGPQRLTLTAQSNNINVQNFTSPDGGGGNSGAGGITSTNAGGINYSDNWGKKIDISGSYFFNESNTTVNSELHQVYILPADSGQIYDQNSQSATKNYTHRFSMSFNYTADTLNSVSWQPSFSLNKNSGSSMQQGNTEQNAIPVNQTSNNSITNRTGYNFANSFLFRHKFNKKGRTFSANANVNDNNNNGAVQRDAQNVYYSSPSLNNTLNQQGLQAQNTWNLVGNATYTEPYGEHGLLKLEYNISYLPAQSQNNTYDYSYLTNSYSIPDSLYSNSFYSRNIAQKTGSSYQVNTGKCEISIGLYYQFTELINDQALPVDYNLNRDFQNFLPVASFHYKFSKTKNLQITYNTNTQAPSVSQLQNVVNNMDPIHLYTGNPDLLQPYSHNLTLRYNSMDKNMKHIFSASVTGNYMQNGITSNAIVATNDTFVTTEHILLAKGSQLTMPVNLNGNTTLNSDISYGLPLDYIKCNLKFNIDASLNRMPAIINNQVNEQDNKTGSFGISLSSNISEHVDFMVSSNTSIVSSADPLSTVSNTTYVNENCRATIKLVFWKEIVFNSNLSYQTNSGLSETYNQDCFLWNMSIGKKIFKKNRGEIRLSAFDLLNQNNNIQHTVTPTYIEDSRSNMVQRYFLLVFTYKISNFKKMPLQSP